MAASNEQNAPASSTIPASDDMEVAKSISNKQDKPVRATTSTTNDEVTKLAGQFEKLLAEVSTTPISQSSPTPTTAIVPIKKTAPPQQSKPSKTNPFYTTSALTLGTAATKIHSILRAALLFINHLRILDINSVSAIVQKSSPDAQLNRLCADLRYVLEFLRFGREGWELTYLPHQFFKDVLPMVDELQEKMRDLVEKANGGEWVSEKGVLVLKDIGKEMVGIQKKRMVKEEEAKKGKGKKVKGKEVKGDVQEETQETKKGVNSETMEEAKEIEKEKIGKAESVME